MAGTSESRIRIANESGSTVANVETKGVKNGLDVVLLDSDGNQIEFFDAGDYSVMTTDDVDGNIEYVGWTLPENQLATGSAVWKIAKVTYTAGGNPIMKYADSVNTFTKTWDLKGNYVY